MLPHCDSYLSAAYELVNKKLQPTQEKSDQLEQMPPETLLDYISIFFDGELAASKIYYDTLIDIQRKNKDGSVKNTYFEFVIKNGAILYYEITEDEYKNKEGDTVIDFNDLKNAAKGSYKETKETEESEESCNILSDISNAVIDVASYKRFKYFDIIGRHDNEVMDSNGNRFDLKKEVNDCIQMLEKYVGTFIEDSSVVVLSEEDKQSWTKYSQLLKNDTRVILDSDFFIPGDASMGIGNDFQFMKYELYYTLYSLYRYLYRSYLKNDYGNKGNNFDEESFAKLKQSIVLLETYVADYYLCQNGYSVDFENGDFEAWKYLNNYSTTSLAQSSLTVAVFFEELYRRYKELSVEINSIEVDVIPSNS